MKSYSINPASAIKGEIYLPGDKSITHRAIIISAISQGKTIIENFSLGRDCHFTIQALKNLGVKIILKKYKLLIYGRGLRSLQGLSKPIFVGNSGTTLRLLLGILAGHPFITTLFAGKSLTHRPMRRVTEPLRMMGAKIRAKSLPVRQAGKEQRAKLEEYPPITIQGGNLKPIKYRLPVASAQVKSAILFAGLYAKGTTEIIEPIKTRDHTERMLRLFGADLKIKGENIRIKGAGELLSCSYLSIPGDISSAGFFIVATLILKNSSLHIKSLGLNPSRMGLIRVLKRMGANILVHRSSFVVPRYEPVGDLVVKSSKLKGTRVKKEELPSLIDELPILMVAACYAKGETTIESVQELRVKETDRVNSMVEGLSKMGAKIQAKGSKSRKEDIVITGVRELRAARLRSFSDHRTAMGLLIASLTTKGKTSIDDIACIDKSFPSFLKILRSVVG